MVQEERDEAEASLNVDHGLLSALEGVEHAVGGYLDDLSESMLSALRDALDQLDEHAAASDRWSQSMGSSAAWGYGDIHLAIGQTGMPPVIDQEGASLFKAQVALVQAAKAVVNRADLSSVERLRTALAAVEAKAGQ